MNRDLTDGKPESVLWRFCLPLFGSIVFQQLYNIADSFVAGKFIGEAALAAVGNGYEITLIFIAFAFGCNIGCSVIVSQLFGAKKYAELKTSVYTSFIASAVICAVLVTAGIILCPQLLSLIHTPEDIFADSMLYLNIYIWSFPFVLFYNIATGIFSALGDSKTPFIFLAVSSSANIAADILFVTAFGMGVDGVAWATFICQCVSCLLALLFVFRRLASIKSESRVNIFSWRLLGKIAGVAVPSIAQQSFISVGNIVIQSIINTFGSSVIAGYSAAIKLNNLVITSLSTVGNGISNYTAQNLGAGKINRIREGFRAGLKIAWIICIPIILLYLIAGNHLIYMFMPSPTGTAIDVGVTFLRIVSPFYILSAVILISNGTLRGIGLMSRFMTSTFSDLILRVSLAKLLSMKFGSTGIWLAWPIGWLTASVISVLFYISWTKHNHSYKIRSNI